MEKRLLIVANQIDSFFNHRLPAARAAKAAGYEVHVALADAEAARVRDTDGMTFHHLELSRGFASIPSEIRSLLALDQLLRRIRPDVIHAFTLKPSLYASVVARIRQRPIVVSVTGLGSFFLGNRLSDRILQRILVPTLRLSFGYKRLIAIVQNHDDQDFVEGTLRVPKHAIALVPGSGVDLKQFAPRTHNNDSKAGHRPVKVVLAARMLGDKGIREFVAAATLLKERGADAEHILAGGLDQANRSAIERNEIEEWVTSKSIVWHGQVDDMPALYATTDIACLPSYREGLPKALIEAAACGLPVVTTDVPGCREVIVDGETGILVRAFDPEALADALQTLIQSPDTRQKMGAAGRSHAEKHYGEQSIARQILVLYQRLLDETADATTRHT